MGDPSGIGPEIVAKALSRPVAAGKADFVIIGNRWVFDKIRNSCRSVSAPAAGRQQAGICGRQARCRIRNCRFVDLDNVARRNFSFGKVRAEYGRASIEYLDKALELIRSRDIDCLVTCPISKEAINLAGFNYSGHTEYLSARTGVNDSLMMLLNRELKISLLTRHIPITKVASCLNENRIVKDILLTCESLQRLFLIKKPRIVVCGLNPHASDNGVIGNEENRIIKPALEKLRTLRKGRIDGPLSADAAIFKARQKEYDCVVAMYHDQALIPLKLSGAGKGVNMTLGLPFIRTSVLHGTAFDISGRNLADCASLIESIRLAVKCTLNQRKV
jgi:4-hydroxythreonine-4-phosphate dehydrogenase